MKPYLVMEYLLRKTDKSNVLSSEQIVAYLGADCEIYAERRSIYRDIEEINKAMLMVENNIDVEEAEKWLKDDIDDELKFIVYDKSKKRILRTPPL